MWYGGVYVCLKEEQNKLPSDKLLRNLELALLSLRTFVSSEIDKKNLGELIKM